MILRAGETFPILTRGQRVQYSRRFLRAAGVPTDSPMFLAAGVVVAPISDGPWVTVLWDGEDAAKPVRPAALWPLQ